MIKTNNPEGLEAFTLTGVAYISFILSQVM
jgi:hypothetical protein